MNVIPPIVYLNRPFFESLNPEKSNAKLMTINIKKDALWKPLLRLFRRFVKKTSQAHLIASNQTLLLDCPEIPESKNSNINVSENEVSKAISEIASDYLYPSCEEGIILSLSLILTKAYKILDTL